MDQTGDLYFARGNCRRFASDQTRIHRRKRAPAPTTDRLGTQVKHPTLTSFDRGPANRAGEPPAALETSAADGQTRHPAQVASPRVQAVLAAKIPRGGSLVAWEVKKVAGSTNNRTRTGCKKKIPHHDAECKYVIMSGSDGHWQPTGCIVWAPRDKIYHLILQQIVPQLKSAWNTIGEVKLGSATRCPKSKISPPARPNNCRASRASTSCLPHSAGTLS